MSDGIIDLPESTGGLDPRVTLLTVPDVATHLKVSEKTVRRWIERGELAVHRLGRRVRVSESDLIAFVQEHRKG